MFKMRREQMEAFRREALLDFEGRMVQHVARCFPWILRDLGERGVREETRLAVERAGAYGIVDERDVCMFADLCLVFERDFDRRCAWAREILESEAPSDPSDKMSLLYERAVSEA